MHRAEGTRLSTEEPKLPTTGTQISVNGQLVLVVIATPTATGVDLAICRPDGSLTGAALTTAELKAALVPANDAGSDSEKARTGMWGGWMEHAVPRIRSAVLARRPLKPFAQPEEAIFPHMLAQPRLRFLFSPRLPPIPVARTAGHFSHRESAWDWALMVVGSLMLAAVSLLVLPRRLAYDPWSWLVWGREIAHLELDTRHAATAVKPFPMLVDTLLAPTGSAAPLLWLLVSRAGTFLAFMLAFWVGRRLGGVIAGAVAAVGLAMADGLLGYLFMSGVSDPMTVAAVLAAADSHLRRRRRAALVFLVVAGLLRPEAWPAVVAYGAWLAYASAHRWRPLAALVAAAAAMAVPAVWFLADWFGARSLSRSAEAATHQSQGGPLLSREPGLATVTETWHLMSGQVVVLFLVGFAVALVRWRGRGRPGPLVWLGAGAFGWLAIDAVLAQGRLATGAPRYLLPAVGLACVVAGCLAADVVRLLGRRLRGTRLSGPAARVVAVALVVVCAPRFVYHLAQVYINVVDTQRAAQVLQARLPDAVALAGGRDAVLRCGRVSTGTFQVPLLAWQLDLPLHAIGVVHPHVTGTVIEAGPPTLPPAELRRFRQLAVGSGPASGSGPAGESRTWTVLTTCSARGAGR